MAKPNTRELDRIIKTAQGKLDAIQRRQTWALSGSEQARLAAHGAVVLGKGMRQNSSPRAERAMQGIWEGAESRFRAEIRAANEAKEAATNEAAAAKVAKKSKGRW